MNHTGKKIQKEPDFIDIMNQKRKKEDDNLNNLNMPTNKYCYSRGKLKIF